MLKSQIEKISNQLRKIKVGSSPFFKLTPSNSHFTIKTENNILSILIATMHLIERNIDEFNIIDINEDIFIEFDDSDDMVIIGEEYEKEIPFLKKNLLEIAEIENFDSVLSFENKELFIYTPYISDNFIVPNVILHTAAGYYWGSVTFESGYMEPYSRESDYYFSKKEVDKLYPNISIEYAQEIAKQKGWID